MNPIYGSHNVNAPLQILKQRQWHSKNICLLIRNVKLNISSNGRHLEQHHEKLYVPLHGNTTKNVCPLNLWANICNVIKKILKSIWNEEMTRCAKSHAFKFKPTHGFNKCDEDKKTCLKWCWKRYGHVMTGQEVSWIFFSCEHNKFFWFCFEWSSIFCVLSGPMTISRGPVILGRKLCLFVYYVE